MKNKSCQWFTVLTLLVLATINASLATLFAQGTAFTYQGRLNVGTNAANGSYDLRFALFDTFTTGTGTQQGNLLTNSATAVTNGLFTVQLDFGNQFPGAPRWLEIGVRSNGVAGFTPLTPREPLTPAPYAIYAESANASNLVGTVQPANLSAANIPGVALLAGGNAFTGDQTVTSGNVGIGTSSPDARLQIVGTGLSDDAMLMVQSTGGVFGPQLRLNKGGPGGDEWVFVANGTVNGPVGALQIVDSNSGAARLAIGTNGNVGIGTTSPANKLDVQGPADFTGNVGIGILNPNDSVFGLSISNSTSSNSALLLTGNNPVATGMAIENTSSGGHRYDVFSTGNGASGGGGAFSIFDENNSATRLQIVPSGNVGIGTATPNSALAVYGNIFMGKQRNNTTFNQVGDTIYLGAEQKYLGNTLGTPVDGSTDWINLMANSLSAGIMFGLSTSTANPHSNNIPLMVIRSNGNVGIGATNPAAKLEVNGSAQVDGALAATSLRAPGQGINTGTFAFIQRATAVNTVNFYTIIDNPVCNNDPNAILIITHNISADTNSTSANNTTPVGVFYNAPAWTIWNEDFSNMKLGRAFNVMVIKP